MRSLYLVKLSHYLNLVLLVSGCKILFFEHVSDFLFGLFWPFLSSWKSGWSRFWQGPFCLVLNASQVLSWTFSTSMEMTLLMQGQGHTFDEAYGKCLGTIIVTSLIIVAMSFLPAKVIRRLFPPIVPGVVIFMVSFSAENPGQPKILSLGQYPPNKSYADNMWFTFPRKAVKFMISVVLKQQTFLDIVLHA